MWALALALRCRREQRSCFRLAPRAILLCRGGTNAISVAFGQRCGAQRAAPKTLSKRSAAIMGAGASVDEGVTVNGELAKVLSASDGDLAATTDVGLKFARLGKSVFGAARWAARCAPQRCPNATETPSVPPRHCRIARGARRKQLLCSRRQRNARASAHKGVRTRTPEDRSRAVVGASDTRVHSVRRARIASQRCADAPRTARRGLVACGPGSWRLPVFRVAPPPFLPSRVVSAFRKQLSVKDTLAIVSVISAVKFL